MVRWRYVGNDNALEISKNARFIIKVNKYPYTEDDRFILLDRGQPLKKIHKSKKYFARSLFICKIIAEDIVDPIVRQEENDK